MRGAHTLVACYFDRSGIIPADAGSTNRGCLDVRVREDHPRGCGEHSCGSLARLSQSGSSPRMRGALSACLPTCRRLRIIPADAGSTYAIFGDSDSESGSSPRMRGAPQLNKQNSHYSRIIPADAGSTSPGFPWTATIKDHPRGCGEHTGTIRLMNSLEGSSPRMRGALEQCVGILHDVGIIPADAGSTASCPSAQATAWDHPRGCGEHSSTLMVVG